MNKGREEHIKGLILALECILRRKKGVAKGVVELIKERHELQDKLVGLYIYSAYRDLYWLGVTDKLDLSYHFDSYKSFQFKHTEKYDYDYHWYKELDKLSAIEFTFDCFRTKSPPQLHHMLPCITANEILYGFVARLLGMPRGRDYKGNVKGIHIVELTNKYRCDDIYISYNERYQTKLARLLKKELKPKQSQIINSIYIHSDVFPPSSCAPYGLYEPIPPGHWSQNMSKALQRISTFIALASPHYGECNFCKIGLTYAGLVNIRQNKIYKEIFNLYVVLINGVNREQFKEFTMVGDTKYIKFIDCNDLTDDKAIVQRIIDVMYPPKPKPIASTPNDVMYPPKPKPIASTPNDVMYPPKPKPEPEPIANTPKNASIKDKLLSMFGIKHGKN